MHKWYSDSAVYKYVTLHSKLAHPRCQLKKGRLNSNGWIVVIDSIRRIAKSRLSQFSAKYFLYLAQKSCDVDELIASYKK